MKHVYVLRTFDDYGTGAGTQEYFQGVFSSFKKGKKALLESFNQGIDFYRKNLNIKIPEKEFTYCESDDLTIKKASSFEVHLEKVKLDPEIIK